MSPIPLVLSAPTPNPLALPRKLILDLQCWTELYTHHHSLVIDHYSSVIPKSTQLISKCVEYWPILSPPNSWSSPGLTWCGHTGALVFHSPLIESKQCSKFRTPDLNLGCSTQAEAKVLLWPSPPQSCFHSRWKVCSLTFSLNVYGTWSSSISSWYKAQWLTSKGTLGYKLFDGKLFHCPDVFLLLMLPFTVDTPWPTCLQGMSFLPQTAHAMVSSVPSASDYKGKSSSLCLQLHIRLCRETLHDWLDAVHPQWHTSWP